jgi:hypothetical protein
MRAQFTVEEEDRWERRQAMSDEFKSPFVPGARVAISDFHGDNYREGFVEKVFKTGNFTLRGSAQQWRPSYFRPLGEGPLRWSASQTGKHMRFSSRNLKIWNSETEAEITEHRAFMAREHKRRELCDRLSSIPDDALTDALLAQIEAALPAKEALIVNAGRER